MSFQKLQTKIINYRDYKSFDNEKFRSDIWRVNLNATHLEGFMKTLFHIFNKYAPIKRKYIRANEALFMAKDLSNKFSKSEKINLTEGNKTVSNDDELCLVFNNFFTKIVDELKFRIFQTINLITLMIRSKKHSDILKITLVLPGA